eukprot:EG_transcript_27711
MKSFKHVDFFRRVPVDLTEPTMPGAIISIICGLIMAFLFLSEFRAFLQYDEKSEMLIQQDKSGFLRLNFNLTFPKFPCAAFSLDVVDIMGRHEVGVASNVAKTRLTPGRMPITGENGGIGTEGCNTVGYVDVNKVPGSFHISAHGLQSFVKTQLGGQLDVNHIVHSFWVGDVELSPRDFPGPLRPMDGLERLTGQWSKTFEYFIDIIPTIYSNPSLEDTKAYQFTFHTRD